MYALRVHINRPFKKKLWEIEKVIKIFNCFFVFSFKKKKNPKMVY